MAASAANIARFKTNTSTRLLPPKSSPTARATKAAVGKLKVTAELPDTRLRNAARTDSHPPRMPERESTCHCESQNVPAGRIEFCDQRIVVTEYAASGGTGNGCSDQCKKDPSNQIEGSAAVCIRVDLERTLHVEWHTGILTQATVPYCSSGSQ